MSQTFFQRNLRAPLVVFLTAGIALAGLLGWVQRQWQTPLQIAETTFYSVPSGTVIGKIEADLVADYGMSPRWFGLYVRLLGLHNIKAGEYLLQPGDTPRAVVEKLNKGEVVSFQITFPEGWTLRQWLAHLHTYERIANTLEGKSDAEIIAALGLSLNHLEGWFFPDTYHFGSGESDVDILRRAYLKMAKVLDEEWQNRQSGLPINSPYEALILASIVEKETGVAAERQTIAGVFVRRLVKGMRLQTDPTVIYGLGADYRGNITRKHLRQATPYNTYKIDGLPPTPIAMPGRAAIHAALNPAPGEALFFVARGDGSHVFSATLEEHNKAVRNYQMRRVEDYRSSPPPVAELPTTEPSPAEKDSQ